MKKGFALVLITLSLGLLTMCGGGGGNGVESITGTSGAGTDGSGTSGTGADGAGTGATSSTGSAAGTGSLRVLLTDKPAEQYEAVNVTIAKIRVHQSADADGQGAGWTELAVTATMPVDLLTLRNGVLRQLCEAELAAGHYQQVRMVLTPNSGSEAPYNQSVVTADGVTHPLELSSGEVKIVHAFTAATSETTDLTLDFDASKSIVQRGTGTYALKPTIKASSTSAATTTSQASN